MKSPGMSQPPSRQLLRQPVGLGSPPGASPGTSCELLVLLCPQSGSLGTSGWVLGMALLWCPAPGCPQGLRGEPRARLDLRLPRAHGNEEALGQRCRVALIFGVCWRGGISHAGAGSTAPASSSWAQRLLRAPRPRPFRAEMRYLARRRWHGALPAVGTQRGRPRGAQQGWIQVSPEHPQNTFRSWGDQQPPLRAGSEPAASPAWLPHGAGGLSLGGRVGR